jgi:MATE family multidrug resistance protein
VVKPSPRRQRQGFEGEESRLIFAFTQQRLLHLASGYEAMNSNATLTYRGTLALAVPMMLANVSTPLLGLVDTAVVGQLPGPAYIGAVAIGALIFSVIFWTFGFLRMGTTGLTAQAFGAADDSEVAAGLARALVLSGLIGVTLISLQWPILEFACWVLDAPGRVEEHARSYFNIRIWAAPATLANYAMLGWFVGLGRARTALLIQLILNVSNIALDALFVLVFGWDVRGVAGGTLVAEYFATAMGLMLVWQHLDGKQRRLALVDILDSQRLRRTLAVNRDIMIRSLALIVVFAWFTVAGARQGEIILAANAVLMQFVATGAYLLDGFAHTAETLVGRACGSRDRGALSTAVRVATILAALCAIIVALVVAGGGAHFIDFMTVDEDTREAARRYLPWVIAAPLLGVWAFQLDGIFIGATHTAEMRRAMLFSLAVFIPTWALLLPFANHGLWAALSLHYLVRTASLLYYYPRLRGTLS